ncbi:MAG: ATP-binding protein [Paraclostridium sp.]
MKKTLKTIIIIVTMISLNNIYAYEENDEDGFNVLVLNSYHQGHHWESNIEEGLRSTIEERSEENINLKYEYLDFRNKNDEKYIESLKEMLEAKYPRGSIDAIYTVDDESYEAFHNEILNKESEFYKIPLVFSGVDNKSDGTKEEKKYMSGIYHGDDSLSLFNLINRLSPHTNTINLIIEESLYCDSVKAEIDSLVNGYLKEYMSITYIRSDYIEDIEYQLKRLNKNPNAINILAGEFQFKSSGKYVNPEIVINTIKKNSSAPIYSNDQTYMYAGILGGHIDVGQEHGEIIGNMLIDIKNGKSIANISNDIEPEAKAYIDYNSIYEYGINPLYITDDVEILNKKWNQVLAPVSLKIGFRITFIIVVIGVFVIFYGIVRYRRKKVIEMEELKKAEDRMKLKTDFIVNLSHELRTPINIILGTSNVLECNIKKNEINPENIYKKIDNIRQNSYRLLKISNNIIDITKAESGMLKLKLENCNIVSVIEDTFTSAIDFANRKNIEMVFDTEVEELIIAIDIFQIQRVILNLISNAIKFTHEGGKIDILIYQNSNEVIVSVKDNGVGIANDKINYIFHRFYQVDSLLTRKSEGSGIGLCIAKDIVNIHGGKIVVESKEGVGSEFKVCLPINIIDKYEEFDNQKILDINKNVDLEMSDI